MQDSLLRPKKLNDDNVIAFKELFKFFYPKMKALACRFVDEQSAEDVVQDIFTSLWHKREGLSIDNASSFLYKSTQNSCLNLIKHRSIVDNHSSQLSIAERRILYLDETYNNDVWRYMHRSDIEKSIKEAINTLSPKCAEVFQLSYLEGLTNKEIAARLGISIRTTENHIYQALIQLRPKLQHLLFALSTLGV